MSRPTFSTTQLVLRGMRRYALLNALFAMMTALAAATIAGAFYLGDSMRESLRARALQRLGNLDVVVTFDSWADEKIVERLRPKLAETPWSDASPAIVVSGVLSVGSGIKTNHLPVTILGLDEESEPTQNPNEGAINLALARKIGLVESSPQRGELSLFVPNALSPESLFGDPSAGERRMTITLGKVLSDEAWCAKFSLRNDQRTPQIITMSRERLARALRQPNRFNTLFLSEKKSDSPASTAEQARDLLARLAPWRLEDLGIDRIVLTDTEPFTEAILAKRLVFSDPQRAAIETLLKNEGYLVPVSFGLANTIRAESTDRAISYSLLAGIDCSSLPKNRLSYGDPPLAPLKEDEMVLNDWSAKNIGVDLGDRVRIDFFSPEEFHRTWGENHATFRVGRIVPLTGIAGTDQFVPTVEGVTDADSLADWHPPFPFDAKRITPADESYWDEFRATPKGWISLVAAEKLWQSRFGLVGAFLFFPKGTLTVEHPLDLEKIGAQLNPEEFGIHVEAVRTDGLAASVGTTPFDLLFLCFGGGIIFAALLLLSLLARLMFDQRLAEIGLLRMLGFSRRAVFLLFFAEWFPVTCLGGGVGAALGAFYACGILTGMVRWGFASIDLSFLRFSMRGTSFFLGAVSATLMALMVLAISFWGLRRVRPGELERTADPIYGARRAGASFLPRWPVTIFCFTSLASLAMLSVASRPMGSMMRAGIFFGSGALLLASMTTLLSVGLFFVASPDTNSRRQSFGMIRLVLKRLARTPRVTLLNLLMFAVPLFLILAVGAFWVDPTHAPRGPISLRPDGGFAVIAETTLPIFADLNQPDERAAWLAEEGDEAFLASVAARFVPLRVAEGDDASCANLYRTNQPRLVGLPRELLDADRFGRVKRLASTAAAGPLAALAEPIRWTNGSHQRTESSPTASSPIPVIPVAIDENTAVYSLHLTGALGEIFPLRAGSRPLFGRVAAILSDSIFQGDVVTSEENLTTIFPQTAGATLFLVGIAEESESAETIERLESVVTGMLRDVGGEVETSVARQARFALVQNAYLVIFQTLGGLAFFLGGIGFAIVSLRRTLARKEEFALFNGLGFGGRITGMIFLETFLFLLFAGGVAIPAAQVAVWPQYGGNAAWWGMFVGWFRSPGGPIGPILALAIVGLVAAGLSALAVRVGRRRC